MEKIELAIVAIDLLGRALGAIASAIPCHLMKVLRFGHSIKLL